METTSSTEAEMDQRQIGLSLYQAEQAIGIGRRAVRELRTTEPVDDEEIARQQAVILAAQQDRNLNRRRLEQAKRRDAPWPKWSW